MYTILGIWERNPQSSLYLYFERRNLAMNSYTENLTHLVELAPAKSNLQTLVRATRKNGLDLDPLSASCQVLAALAGDGILPVDAFDTLAEHSRALHECPDEEILDSLTRQSSLLEALWLHFAARAAKETRSDHSAILCKASLNCQKSLQGCLGAIHQLTEKRQDAEAIES